MGFNTIAALKMKDNDDFHRVLTFVQPEEEGEPSSDDEYDQILDFVDTLPIGERCAWMTRHCKRLYVDFHNRTEKREVSWSGRSMIGDLAVYIAELVVAQFPDIEFRVSKQYDYDLKFGISEQGEIKWLELSDDVNEMFDWGIDVDPYTDPTPENWEALRQHRRDRVQGMIDLGVHISPDTWPPTIEQIDEEISLQSASLDVNSDLPF